jgi:type II secretory pathway pseudopilin PulG
MILAFKKNVGITLMELLVVVAIMMVGLTLVGPFSLGIVDKTRAQVEWMQFGSVIKSLSAHAFLGARPVTVILDQSNLRAYRAGELITEKEYTYLAFSETAPILIDRNGLISTYEVMLEVNGQRRNLVLQNPRDLRAGLSDD